MRALYGVAGRRRGQQAGQCHTRVAALAPHAPPVHLYVARHERRHTVRSRIWCAHRKACAAARARSLPSADTG
jgi:hypothetical protein